MHPPSEEYKPVQAMPLPRDARRPLQTLSLFILRSAHSRQYPRYHPKDLLVLGTTTVSADQTAIL